MKRFALLTLLLTMFTLGLTLCPVQAQDVSYSPKTELCWPILKRDTKGEAVKTLQGLLRARGYTTVADGKFGYGTETVVRKFQKVRHLKQDGTVGWQTWEALVPTLRLGSRGATVRLLQNSLNRYGNGVPKVKVDGVYGAATQRAVSKLYTTIIDQSAAAKGADAVIWCYLNGGYYEQGE